MAYRHTLFLFTDDKGVKVSIPEELEVPQISSKSSKASNGSNSVEAGIQAGNAFQLGLDNSGKLQIAPSLGYQAANYKEILPYLEEYNNRNFDWMAKYSGISALGNAFSSTGGYSTVFG